MVSSKYLISCVVVMFDNASCVLCHMSFVCIVALMKFHKYMFYTKNLITSIKYWWFFFGDQMRVHRSVLSFMFLILFSVLGVSSHIMLKLFLDFSFMFVFIWEYCYRRYRIRGCLSR